MLLRLSLRGLSIPFLSTFLRLADGKRRDYMRAYYRSHREKQLEYSRRYSRKRQMERRPDDLEIDRVYRLKIKREVLSAYGKACTCCGEVREEFLQLDHIDSHGRLSFRNLGLQSGSQFYLWLRRNKYPVGLQILCATCNLSKGNGLICAIHNRPSYLLSSLPDMEDI